MPSTHIAGPFTLDGFANPGSAAGLAARQLFIHNLCDLCPDMRALWVPLGTDTTTSTDASANARVLTWDATIAARFNILGAGLSVNLNGSSQYASAPDTDNLSFADSLVDQPFSIFAWVRVTSSALGKTILAKFNSATASREWILSVDGTDKLGFELWDESAVAKIGRVYNTAVPTGSEIFVAGTYDGTRASTGIHVYSAAVKLDDTNSNSGTYVAMENQASLLYLGVYQSPLAGYFNGRMAAVGLTAKQLSVDELWALKAVGNSYYGLTL